MSSSYNSEEQLCTANPVTVMYTLGTRMNRESRTKQTQVNNYKRLSSCPPDIAIYCTTCLKPCIYESTASNPKDIFAEYNDTNAAHVTIRLRKLDFLA